MLILTDNDVIGAVRALRRILESPEWVGPESLPVLTISDPRRVIREPVYARECAISLLDFVERIETLRGTGRLFIP